MSKPESDKSAIPAEERARLEGLYTEHRIFELALDPVRGNFDAAHLREINRRIFQDLPAYGFDDVTPGQYRPSAPVGKDWMKNRVLSTSNVSYFVAYSAMDKSAQERLDKVLKGAVPAKLRNLDVEEFTTTLVKLYAELDYTHPFSDGNSRTLRTFTRQLAKESGYELDWTRFNASEVGRDLLYIARDRSVNLLAKPHIQHEQSMRKIVHSMDRLEGNKDLAGLLQDVVRPNRAVAFEKLTEAEALQQHPELATAYRTLQESSVYFAARLPESLEARQQATKSVAKHIQDYLSQGEYRNFSAARDAAKAERTVEPPSVPASEKSPDRER